jgi:hypothetical protein
VAQASCHSGVYLTALAERGYASWGTQVDPDYLSATQSLNPQLAQRLTQGDLLEFFDLLRGPLSLVFCLQPGLAELADFDQVTDVLAQMLDQTLPGGCLLIELTNFDHLLWQAERARDLSRQAGTQGLPLAQEPEYVELLESSPLSGSPQLASLSEDGLRLYLPPLSAALEDGSMAELEQVYLLGAEASPDSAAPETLLFRQSLRCPEGSFSGSQELLCLTRERLERSLAEALARTHNQGAQISWLGGFDRSDWSHTKAQTLLLLR